VGEAVLAAEARAAGVAHQAEKSLPLESLHGPAVQLRHPVACKAAHQDVGTAPDQGAAGEVLQDGESGHGGEPGGEKIAASQVFAGAGRVCRQV
jgi:hypothetical protein